LFGLTACEGDRPLAPAGYRKGHQVYYGYCSGCHEMGDPKVPNLRLKRFWPTHMTDAVMMQSIRNGRGRMPPQGGMLKDEHIKEVIRYVRLLQKQARQEKASKKP